MSKTDNIVLQAANWAYDRALQGVSKAGIESADELAACYMSQPGTLESKVDSLIRWQIAKASSAGFLTGLGGFTTMAITLPANITMRWSPKVGQAGSLTQSQQNDPHVEETSSAQS